MSRKPKTQDATGVVNLAAYESERDFRGLEWRKVRAPQAWRPEPGDELTGKYLGSSKRTGRFGEYKAFHVFVPGQGTWYITGAGIEELMSSAQVERGAPVRVVFKGVRELKDDKTFKEFELFVAKDAP